MKGPRGRSLGSLALKSLACPRARREWDLRASAHRIMGEHDTGHLEARVWSRDDDRLEASQEAIRKLVGRVSFKIAVGAARPPQLFGKTFILL